MTISATRPGAASRQEASHLTKRKQRKCCQSSLGSRRFQLTNRLGSKLRECQNWTMSRPQPALMSYKRDTGHSVRLLPTWKAQSHGSRWLRRSSGVRSQLLLPKEARQTPPGAPSLSVDWPIQQATAGRQTLLCFRLSGCCLPRLLFLPQASHCGLAGLSINARRFSLPPPTHLSFLFSPNPLQRPQPLASPQPSSHLSISVLWHNISLSFFLNHLLTD